MRASISIPFLVLALLLPIHWSYGAPNRLELEFEETPLTTVVDYFRSRSQALSPNGQPLNFVISPELDGNLTVHVTLREATVSEAFTCVLEQMSLDYRMDASACVIVDAGKGVLANRPPHKPADAARFKSVLLARQTVFPQIEYDEAPLGLIVQHLAERQYQDPNREGALNLIVTRWLDPELPVTLKLKDASIAAVLGRISARTGIEVRAEPYAIVLDPPGTALYRAAQRKAAQRGQAMTTVRLHHQPRQSQRSNPLAWIPKDPRSPAHPDYVRSNHPDVTKRTNAHNNVYKWVNGKWTYVRTGAKGLDSVTLEPAQGGLDSVK